jgi:hypothetical protein
MSRVALVGKPVLRVRAHDLAQLGGQLGRRVEQSMADRHLPQCHGEGLGVAKAFLAIDGQRTVKNRL